VVQGDSERPIRIVVESISSRRREALADVEADDADVEELGDEEDVAKPGCALSFERVHMLEPVGRHEATERGRFAPSLGVRQGAASIAHSESQRRALLLPDRGDERHQDEAGSDPDQKPGAEVAEQDAKPMPTRIPPINAGPPYA